MQSGGLPVSEMTAKVSMKERGASRHTALCAPSPSLAARGEEQGRP